MNISDTVLQALIETRLDEKRTFADTLKEVRRHDPKHTYDLRTAVQLTTFGLQLAAKAGREEANVMLENWRAIHTPTPRP